MRATRFSKLLAKGAPASEIPFQIQQAVSQTAKAMQIVNSAGTEVFSILADGIGEVRYAEVTIPAASVLTLNSVPYTLVAAPGAGKVLEFLGAMFIMDYGSAAYAGIAAGEDLAIRYTDGSGAVVSTTLETTGLLDQTADQMRTFKPITTDVTPVANAPLVLALATGDITTGDSPVRVKVRYVVHSTGL